MNTANVKPVASDQPRHLPNHEPVLLNDPDLAWRVLSGRVAICRLPGNTAAEKGQCFFTVKPGEVIFGVAPQETALVAIALQPTVVVPV